MQEGWDLASALYHQPAKTAAKLYQPNDLRIVPSLTSIATPSFDLGDYAAAEPLFQGGNRRFGIAEVQYGTQECGKAVSQ
jgi:hypothetical protein